MMRTGTTTGASVSFGGPAGRERVIERARRARGIPSGSERPLRDIEISPQTVSLPAAEVAEPAAMP
jgi:hypothetical protein